MNSADLQGFVRSELEALSAGIDDLSSDLSSVFIHEESSKFENAAIDLSVVLGNYSCSPRQDEEHERRQGRTCSLIFWKGRRKVAKTQLSQTFAR